MRELPVSSQSLIRWGVATAPYPGENESGDRHLVVPRDDWVLLAGVDGLGHGHEAAVAADRAIEVLRYSAHEALIPLTRRCHDRLVGTRGVVMTLIRIGAADETLTWLGVGNVQAALFRDDGAAGRPREVLLQRSGVVGYNLPALSASVLPLAPGDLVVLASDGVRPEFMKGVVPEEEPQPLAERLIRQYREENDDALVLTARYQGRG